MDPQKRREKAIDFAGETSKLLITLSTAFVAFTVTFSEKLGGLIVDSDLGRWLLILVWGAFIVSIGGGIATQLALTQELEPKTEAGKKLDPSIRSRPVKTLFALQVASFVLATALGAAFGVWRIYQPPRPETKGALPISLGDAPPGLFTAGGRLLFPSAESRLKNEKMSFDLTATICQAKRDLVIRGSTVAIVIGRYDQRPLSEGAQRKFSTNAGLAQRRAEEVGRVLEDAHSCGLPTIGTVVKLIAAPRNVGLAAGDSTHLQDDRDVTIYGWSLSSNSRAPRSP